MDKGLTENLRDGSTWRRVLYMLLFVVIFGLLGIVLAAVVLLQLLLKLLTGGVNPRLQRLGGDLGVYVQRIVAFLAYATEQMPYPFSAWPQAPVDAPMPDEESPDAPPDGSVDGPAVETDAD